MTQRPRRYERASSLASSSTQPCGNRTASTKTSWRIRYASRRYSTDNRCRKSQFIPRRPCSARSASPSACCTTRWCRPRRPTCARSPQSTRFGCSKWHRMSMANAQRSIPRHRPYKRRQQEEASKRRTKAMCKSKLFNDLYSYSTTTMTVTLSWHLVDCTAVVINCCAAASASFSFWQIS